MNYMSNLKNLLLMIMLVCCVGCGRKIIEKKLPEVIVVKRVDLFHTASDTDSVSSISLKYKMKRSDLIKFNNLTPPYNLHKGQKLIIMPQIEQTKEVDANEGTVIALEENNCVEEIAENEEEQKLQLKNEEKTNSDDVSQLQSEYIWPIIGGADKVLKQYEDGIIIDASAGTPVYAIADGEVVIADILPGEAVAYGKTVIIKHKEKKKLSIYSHLNEISIKVGDNVKRGQKIGTIGKTGTAAKRAQLYFEIVDISDSKRKSIEPQKILSK